MTKAYWQLKAYEAERAAKQEKDERYYAESGSVAFNKQVVTPTTLPQDSAARKEIPLFQGVLQYFPAALAEVAKVSKFGNDKHNAHLGHMQHTRGLSMDHADCLLRHLVDIEGGAAYDPESGLPQVAYVAWRALALAQEWLEEHHGAPMAPNAKEKE